MPHSIVFWTIAYTIVFALLFGFAAVWATYATSRRLIEQNAVRAAGVTATARRTDLIRTVTSQRDRVRNVLELAEQSCNAAGSIDEECLRKISLDFVRAERATFMQLLVGGVTVTVGAASLPRDARTPRGEELVRFGRDEGGKPYYLIAVTETGRRVLVRYPMTHVQAIFEDRAGTGAAGETFLTDFNGRFLTPPRYPAGELEPEDSPPLQRCLSGTDGEMISRDYRGAEVVQGFRWVPEIGGGCVVASLERAEVLNASTALRREVISATMLVLIPLLVLGIIAARLLTRPLERLTRRAEAVTAGDYDTPVEARGPREIRVLGSTLASLVESTRESLVRERDLRLEAEEANRAKDQFMATLSHELRTPITAVIGWAKMLQLQPDDPEIRANGIDAIQRSSKVQAELIDDLLDASRIATGKLRLEVRPFDLRTLVSDLGETFRPSAEAKRIRLTVNVPGRRVMVEGDEARLSQVVNNLLTNALKFTPEDGVIEVELTCADGFANLTVHDSGIGIDPQYLQSIFEPFRQQDSSSTRRHGGLGLGLAIVKQIVEMHHGTVSAESEGAGSGATMRVVLPLATAAAETTSEQTQRSLERFGGKRVLVVDDEEGIATLVATVFRSSGAEVEIATSARQAAEQIAESEFDLIVSDIAMPEEDGLSLIRRLRDSGTTIPAIALTALGGLDDEQRALTAGFDAFLRKPVDPVSLARTASKVVNGTSSADRAAK